MSDAPATKPCRRCRRELPEHARYCPECGYTTQERGDVLKPIGLMLILLGACLLIFDRPDER